MKREKGAVSLGQFSKRFSISTVLLVAIAISPVASADNDWDWSHAEGLVARCAAQPFAWTAQGKKAIGTLQSLCPEVEVTESSAVLQLDHRAFRVEIQPSPLSDEGDLNDLTVRDEQGEVVAQRSNVPAFNDVLLAIGGGDGRLQARWIWHRALRRR